MRPESARALDRLYSWWLESYSGIYEADLRVDFWWALRRSFPRIIDDIYARLSEGKSSGDSVDKYILMTAMRLGVLQRLDHCRATSSHYADIEKMAPGEGLGYKSLVRKSAKSMAAGGAA